MSTLIATAILIPEWGVHEYDSVDEPDQVAAAWVEARRSGEGLVIRRVTYKAVPPDGETPHAGSPREVTEVSQIWVNPDWVESIRPGNYPEASAAWREQKDK